MHAWHSLSCSYTQMIDCKAEQQWKDEKLLQPQGCSPWAGLALATAPCPQQPWCPQQPCCPHPHSWGSAQLQSPNSTGTPQLWHGKKHPKISFSTGRASTAPAGTLSWVCPLSLDPGQGTLTARAKPARGEGSNWERRNQTGPGGIDHTGLEDQSHPQALGSHRTLQGQPCTGSRQGPGFTQSLHSALWGLQQEKMCCCSARSTRFTGERKSSSREAKL